MLKRSWGTVWAQSQNKTKEIQFGAVGTVEAQLGHIWGTIVYVNVPQLCPNCAQTSFFLVCPEIVVQLCPNCASTVPQLCPIDFMPQLCPTPAVPQLCPNCARDFSILCPN